VTNDITLQMGTNCKLPTQKFVAFRALQCGLSSRVLDVLRKGGFERPLPIQAQALPGGQQRAAWCAGLLVPNTSTRGALLACADQQCHIRPRLASF
jgi:hypothetical protein